MFLGGNIDKSVLTSSIKEFMREVDKTCGCCGNKMIITYSKTMLIKGKIIKRLPQLHCVKCNITKDLDLIQFWVQQMSPHIASRKINFLKII